MNRAYIFFPLLFLLNSAQALKINDPDTLTWHKINSSIEQAVFNHIRAPIVGDGQLFILRFFPSDFDIELIEFRKNNLLKTANFWTDSMNYSLIVNAGMYNLKNEKIHRFYMQNEGIINNPILDNEAKGVIAFNPILNDLPNFKLFDLTTTDFSNIQHDYNTIIQGFRLIDGEGKPIIWETKNQFCSMLVIAQDDKGYIYIVFSRSPLSQNQMIENILALNLGLKNAIYLEGGVKASLSISAGNFKLKKVGSYVSNYYPFNTNYSMPKFPNFIGFKIK
jgi:hypothetical protein